MQYICIDVVLCGNWLVLQWPKMYKTLVYTTVCLSSSKKLLKARLKTVIGKDGVQPAFFSDVHHMFRDNKSFLLYMY